MCSKHMPERRYSLSLIGQENWMHGYLYIDYDKDYTFSYTLGSDDYPTADGELVSYTFYSPSDSQWGK